MTNSILSLTVADLPRSAEKAVASTRPGILFARQNSSEAMFRIANHVAMSLESGDQVIACTGVRDDDPSGSFAAHCALALARLGRGPLLLVDANFQRKLRPEGTHSHAVGFADLLSGTGDLERVIQHTDVDGLDVLIAGDPAAFSPWMLSSPRASMLLKSMRRYRLVMMDIGAISEKAESMLMASMADVIVATATSGERTRREVTRMKAEADLLSARFLGIVLTDVK